MALRVINDSTLSAIADKIRAKTGKTGGLTPDDGMLTALDFFPDVPEYPKDEPETRGQTACLARAKQLSQLTYTIPVGTITGLGLPVTSANGGYFPEGISETGMWYSSVRVTDYFAGFNISLYTLMTAINNPKSVLYQESSASTLINGNIACTWYGMNCSVFVSYAHGWDYHSATNTIPELSHITEIVNPSELKLCDILNSSLEHGGSVGHAILVTGITRNKDGSIKSIDITESTGPKIITTNISYANLVNNYIGTIGYRIYRDNLLFNSSYEPTPFVHVFDDEPISNITYSNLCPDRGDKVVIKMGEDITLNVLNHPEYANIKVSRNGITFGMYTTTNDDVTITNMSPGRYDAVLCDVDGNPLDNGYASWIVADVTASRKGNRFYFSGDGKPLRVVLKKSGGYTIAVYDITDDDAAKTYKDLEYNGNATPVTVCVPFKYDYGIVTAVFNYKTELIPGDEIQSEPSLIPSEYRQVQFIETDGNQYIDTGVPASNYDDIITYEATARILSLNSSKINNYLFGCLADNKRSGNMNFRTDTMKVCLSIGGTGGIISNNLAIPELNTDFSFTVSMASTRNSVTGELNGDSFARGSSVTTCDMPNANIWILGCNVNGSPFSETSGPGAFRLYNFKMSDINGNEIRNFIPCYRKADNVIGLYDTVSGGFFTNAGTGTFTKGDDVI